ncbi:MAG: arsenate reductase family protein [Acidiphilium sp.]|nr:arsenate reductase family protein [Acidiphilium sp.]MDD4935127.1 arsenate reductase family protein [Acidiphilium sp.]
MATIIFYEKPGCRTNARQKQILASAGHEIRALNLLTEPWTDARLRGFFGDEPVSAWFNMAAPAIKSGTIDPLAVDDAEALALMRADPLLIKRPLLEIDGMQCAGFNATHLATRLGLDLDPDTTPQGCSRPGSSVPCPTPGKGGTT